MVNYEGNLEVGLEESLLRQGILSRETNLSLDHEKAEIEILRSLALRLIVDELRKTLSAEKDPEKIAALTNNVLASIPDVAPDVISPPRVLWAVNDPNSLDKYEVRPNTPLTQFALISNDQRQASFASELELELESADSVDVLISFILLSGVNVLSSALSKLRDRQIPVRVITSTYIGATQLKALKRLSEEFGATVKVDYDGTSERLHAKAWILNRKNNLSTAFVGSSNLSSPAMVNGKEWNVRLAQASAPELFAKLKATFESYWNSSAFEELGTENSWHRLQSSLQKNSTQQTSDFSFPITFLEVTPRPHQTQMLEDLSYAREIENRHRNLIVAATGTGKTILSALDYLKQTQKLGRNPKLLFIAHRREILEQSLRAFREVLKDSNFGEIFIDGHKPTNWQHVFASIQSLARNSETIPLSDYEFVVIDEFHHAEATSYKTIISKLDPSELLGLTATPERSDGTKVQDTFFDGKIASELRLWDALNLDLLSSFTYFGIGDDTDLSDIKWTAGAYSRNELSSKLISNLDARNKNLLREIHEKIPSISNMKALVFCSSKLHAERVSEFLNSHGINAMNVDGDTITDQRILAREQLRSGKIQAITAVDVFNEGVDIPELNTLIMLRPTESPVVFMQQLGRGLRKAEGKFETVVLDFVYAYGSHFRADLKYRALTGSSRGELEHNLLSNFPYLPAGCHIRLDQIARENVLQNVKANILNKPRLVAEILDSGDGGLKQFLENSGRDLFDIYPTRTWTELSISAGLDSQPYSMTESKLASNLKNFIGITDSLRQSFYRELANGKIQTSPFLDSSARRLQEMFFWNFIPTGIDPTTNGSFESIESGLAYIHSHKRIMRELIELLDLGHSETEFHPLPLEHSHSAIPLCSHARYTRYELLAAIDYPKLGKVSSNIHREGVQGAPNLKSDLLLVTIGKAAARTSPEAMYADYSISRAKFHWESQPRTSQDSPTGQRYLSQESTDNRMLLCVRESDKSDRGTTPFMFLGTAWASDLEGSSPIKMTLNLDRPMPLSLYLQTGLTEIA